MKLLVINNLSSGYREGSIYDYLRSVIEDGDEVCIRSTDGSSDLAEFLHDAGDFDVIVASGGDGTVSSVAYLLADTGIPILPFPAGTANLLALNLALPSEPHALAKLTREGELLDFDLGEIELSNGAKRGFTLMAGAGYDATIMAGAQEAKRLLGPMAYFSAAFANPMPQYSHIVIELDGKTIESDGLGILICNFSRIQFDIAVVHENLPRDGIFDVVILKAENAFGLIPVLFTAILDGSLSIPDRPDAVEIHQGSVISVWADPPLNTQYDGEVAGVMTPFTARMLPKAAQFIVTEECLELYGDR